MPSFVDGVFAAIAELQRHHRFVPARALSLKTFASLVRSEEEDIVVYVLVSDGRAGNSNLDVHLWVAPPDQPDDALDYLYIGYKIRIGSEYSVDEQSFRNRQKRIVRFLPSVPCLKSAIRAELKDPPFLTKRLKMYRMQRAILETMLLAAKEGRAEFQAALRDVEELALGKAKIDKIVEVCVPAAELLIAEQRLESEFLESCLGEPGILARVIAPQLYIRCLCAQSDSLRSK